MTFPVQNITVACFGLSYLAALGLELARARWPRRAFRPLGLAFAGAGLVAHTAFLGYHRPPASAPFGALLLVSWVLAVFALYGTLHHARAVWAVFAWPVVLGLVGFAVVMADNTETVWAPGRHLAGAIHGLLVLFAAVGITIGFLASLMYLVQSDRVRRKRNPLGGAKMLSLERLEAMNRRAVTAAFPLLTAGLVLGAVLVNPATDRAEGWLSVKVLGTAGLWLAFLVLLYLRYAAHVPGRRLALLTVLAFVLMLAVLAAAHPFAEAVR